MYKIILREDVNKYGCEELIKIFLRPDLYDLFYAQAEVPDDFCGDGAFGMAAGFDECGHSKYDVIINLSGDSSTEKNSVKRKLYAALSELTGNKHEWGILTGVRPVKLAGNILKEAGSYEDALAELTCCYFVSKEKAETLLDIYMYQQEKLGKPPAKSVGIYIGIPFCPTRCLYCAFASNEAKPGEIERYLTALHKEIDGVAKMMREKGIYPESVYIGGGTPTTLTAEQLDFLMSHVNEAFDISRLKEFTVEAGRPDTIDKEKLRVIKKNGARRISINPQSMKDKTLEIIGRSHKADDIRRAFNEAKEVGTECINADVIAGLQGEDEQDFVRTLSEIIEMGAENITVHTLSVKRASKLVELDKDFHYKQAETVRKQLAAGRKLLAEHGYRPYYLYRQKNMAGGLENTGYCKDDTPSIYNVRIMEDSQTIVALGAGGISKAYYPEENRLERVANVTNYEIYIERLEEMLKRKEENLFREGSTC
ncbi:MAG: coproporphyrinogen dehydrogenase HemZ [Eubacteriales Family XIII. Incertae Sedis bacterium]|nr:MAG: coproporphyrinogen dehydrogenase HemZ [Clostridiales Family XIII bacterium]